MSTLTDPALAAYLPRRPAAPERLRTPLVGDRCTDPALPDSIGCVVDVSDELVRPDGEIGHIVEAVRFRDDSGEPVYWESFGASARPGDEVLRAQTIHRLAAKAARRRVWADADERDLAALVALTDHIRRRRRAA